MRSRHCNRGANPNRWGHFSCWSGKAGEIAKIRDKDPGVRILVRCPLIADRGEDPEKEALGVEERNLPQRDISLGEMPWWSWLALGLLLMVLFLVLSASGDLLAPLIGQAAYAADYLHEFAHDGRHLLAIPCH